MQLSKHSPLNSRISSCSHLGSPEGTGQGLCYTHSVQPSRLNSYSFFQHLPCYRHWAKCWGHKEPPRSLQLAGERADEQASVISSMLKLLTKSQGDGGGSQEFCHVEEAVSELDQWMSRILPSDNRIGVGGFLHYGLCHKDADSPWSVWGTQGSPQWTSAVGTDSGR